MKWSKSQRNKLEWIYAATGTNGAVLQRALSYRGELEIIERYGAGEMASAVLALPPARRGVLVDVMPPRMRQAVASRSVEIDDEDRQQAAFSLHALHLIEIGSPEAIREALPTLGPEAENIKAAMRATLAFLGQARSQDPAQVQRPDVHAIVDQVQQRLQGLIDTRTSQPGQAGSSAAAQAQGAEIAHIQGVMGFFLQAVHNSLAQSPEIDVSTLFGQAMAALRAAGGAGYVVDLMEGWIQERAGDRGADGFDEKWYTYKDTAPIRELSKEEASLALESLEKVFSHFQENKVSESIYWKCVEADDLITNRKFSDDCKYIAYHLDGSVVGFAAARQDAANQHGVWVDLLLSHPGVSNAASALIEGVIEIFKDTKTIRLDAKRGSALVYRRLGFETLVGGLT